MRLQQTVGLGLTAVMLVACDTFRPVGSDWLQVQEQTTCEALQPSACVGAFGFTLTRDGAVFLADHKDPASLPASERTQLAGEIAALDLGARVECDASPTIPGVTDHVDVTMTDGSVVRVFDKGTTPNQTCYRGGREAAIRLHDDVAAQMAKLYGTTIPN